jgi:hypothetical protein
MKVNEARRHETLASRPSPPPALDYCAPDNWNCAIREVSGRARSVDQIGIE